MAGRLLYVKTYVMNSQKRDKYKPYQLVPLNLTKREKSNW